MTVQELIDKLQQIEDKSIKVETSAYDEVYKVKVETFMRWNDIEQGNYDVTLCILSVM